MTPADRAYAVGRPGLPVEPVTRAVERTSAIALEAAISLPPDVLECICQRVAELLSERFEHVREPAEDGWLDVRGAAAYLGSSVSSLHKATARREQGGIPFHQGGARAKCWFLKSELDAWRRNGR